MKEEFENTKEAITSRKSKKDRQYNGQKKQDKQWSTQKTKDWAIWTLNGWPDLLIDAFFIFNESDN